jgi:hypothetical protein
MEAVPRSCMSHSDTVNLLSKLRSSSLFGTGRGTTAAPRPSLKRCYRRPPPLAMGGCFPFFVAREGICCRRVACHRNASLSSPPSHRAAAQHGRHAHERHVGPDARSNCDRSRGALRFVVLLCLCPSRVVPVGAEGKNYHILKLIAIVDSTVH